MQTAFKFSQRPLAIMQMLQHFVCSSFIHHQTLRLLSQASDRKETEQSYMQQHLVQLMTTAVKNRERHALQDNERDKLSDVDNTHIHSVDNTQLLQVILQQKIMYRTIHNANIPIQHNKNTTKVGSTFNTDWLRRAYKVTDCYTELKY